MFRHTLKYFLIKMNSSFMLPTNQYNVFTTTEKEQNILENYFFTLNTISLDKH